MARALARAGRAHRLGRLGRLAHAHRLGLLLVRLAARCHAVPCNECQSRLTLRLQHTVELLSLTISVTRSNPDVLRAIELDKEAKGDFVQATSSCLLWQEPHAQR